MGSDALRRWREMDGGEWVVEFLRDQDEGFCEAAADALEALAQPLPEDVRESDEETWLLFRKLYGIVLEHDRTNAQPKIDRLEAEARSLITAHAEAAVRRERERIRRLLEEEAESRDVDDPTSAGLGAAARMIEDTP